MKRKILALLLSVIALSFVSAQTIAEKKGTMQALEQNKGIKGNLDTINQELATLREQLRGRYHIASELHQKGASDPFFEEVLCDVKRLRSQIAEKEMQWHQIASLETKRGDESYGLWDQEETTLSQLVMEYGSSDHLYIIPPEMVSMKLNLHSSIPIPRESWSELLEIVLSQNGVGIKEVNPYTRQLFILRQNLTNVSLIASDPSHLSRIPDHARLVYLFSPEPENVKAVSTFFERFRDPKRTFVYQVSQKIAVVGHKDEVEKLIGLYNAVWDEANERVTRVISMSRMAPTEMEKILRSFFGGDAADRSRPGVARIAGEGLTIIPLAHENALVLLGPKETVERAETVVRSTEQQVDDPSEMTVFWYTCRHSDPIDLSDVLEKVYSSLAHTQLEGMDKSASKEVEKKDLPEMACNVPQYPDMPSSLPTYGPPPCPPTIQPPPVEAGSIKDQVRKSKTQNFIPYDKTGAIMMVVRKDTLPKIKELLKKLDVPKKMVQIEVLLFEKKIKNEDNGGLNLLKLGSAATNTHKTGLSYETLPRPTLIPGLLDFFISRKKSSSFPAFDLAYSFLMTQEDVRVNASPSVTTINQTPATIKVVEEISINNGAAPLETQTGITFENSFSRAQFGITIVVTPTIHEPDPDDPDGEWYVTMETNVVFDNITSDKNDRPDVTRRQIENLVRVADGETIILGGLRRKTAEEHSEKIPFLGEIPGIAKLFSMTRLADQTTEMFIFITPKIIVDPKTDVVRLRTEQLAKRAGDVPEFVERLCDAQRAQKRRVFSRSWNLIFGSGNDETWCNSKY